MKEMFAKFAKTHQDTLYVIFRVFVGLLFFQHGAMKLFGWFGATSTASVFSLFWFAGIIEVFGGLAIALGVLTRLIAGIAAIEMVVAYLKAHAPSGWVPIMNHGEVALLYFAAFLVIFIYGAKKFSVEKAAIGKELF